MDEAKKIFDIIILNGRPAAGKSEVIDYLKSISVEERIKRFHIGEFELGCLETGNRFAKLNAVLSICDGFRKGLFCHTEGSCSHSQTTIVEDVQGNSETFALLSDHIGRGHRDVMKMNAARF